MKLCKDCRHFMPPGHTSLIAKCGHPLAASTTEPDLIMGTPPRTEHEWAKMMRSGIGRCGLAGALWEPHDEPPQAVPGGGFV